MAAVVAGYRKCLSALDGPFCFLRTLTIERSVMSGCGQGHEPAKNFQRKLCVVSSAGFGQILH